MKTFSLSIYFVDFRLLQFDFSSAFDYSFEIKMSQEIDSDNVAVEKAPSVKHEIEVKLTEENWYAEGEQPRVTLKTWLVVLVRHLYSRSACPNLTISDLIMGLWSLFCPSPGDGCRWTQYLC
jgi:hypothetical protein